MAESASEFKWIFHRVGGLDQVEFNQGADICHLRELDPKLWVALSCPSKGLEFDPRTLTLIDSDKDGRIRIPEVMDAAEWICSRLKTSDSLLAPGDSFPIALIDDSNDTGKRLVATARAILDNLGKPDADSITQEDVTQATLHASEQMFNGDGVLPPMDELDADMRGFIQDAIKVTGGIEDVGSAVGINVEIADAFMKSLADWRDWDKRVAKAETPFGKITPEAWELLSELKNKIDDYFMRCELVAYAPTAQNALNLEDKPLTDETGLLEHKALAELPLSKAGPDLPLDLKSSLNPAWRAKVERFAGLVTPLLSDPGALTRDDWLKIQDGLSPFAQAVAEKPVPVAAPSATVGPTESIEELGVDRVNQLLKGKIRARFIKLANDDANGPAASTDIADMERLVLYYQHLHRLLTNFVNFEEFYDTERTAAFQSGHLYIDGRSCHLCMPADDMEAHSTLASGSQMFLLYCECTRGRKPDGEPEKKMNIVAAVTAGDADLLTQNRNGVYVDNREDDWDARVVKVVSNPIGIWEAVWSPYKKLGSLITDQISKYANEKQAGLMKSAGDKLDEVGTKVVAGAAPRFDMSRNVGMFAAVGLALGAIGTAVGSIFNALLSMSWWQLPLLLVGLFVLISGPSMLLAWLKLRRRTLGPLLEASGWAINGRVALSYGVAKRLSSTAEMPSNSKRSDLDPIVQMKRYRRSVFWIAVGVGVLAVLGVLGVKQYRLAKQQGLLNPPPAAVEEKPATEESPAKPEEPTVPPTKTETEPEEKEIPPPVEDAPAGQTEE